uniref:Putative secreted peptide n=1 Tax=Anopheles braziliensis TaxID=58242 RepID=A0A2M3ZS90_9DIPT
MIIPAALVILLRCDGRFRRFIIIILILIWKTGRCVVACASDQFIIAGQCQRDPIRAQRVARALQLFDDVFLHLVQVVLRCFEIGRHQCQLLVQCVRFHASDGSFDVVGKRHIVHQAAQIGLVSQDPLVGLIHYPEAVLIWFRNRQLQFIVHPKCRLSGSFEPITAALVIDRSIVELALWPDAHEASRFTGKLGRRWRETLCCR